MGMKMKKILMRTVVCVLFLLLVVSVLYGINWLFKLKTTDGCYPMQMFYKQEDDSIDILCLGSSHTYTNINPAVLWEEYGMAAYDLAGSNQPLWNSYYYFKEALKYQSPELVVLDVYRAVESEDYIDGTRVAMNLFGMRYSEDWKECLKESVAYNDMYEDYLLRFPIYHARYQELKKRDFQFFNGDINGKNYKGFNLNCISTTVFEKYPDVTGVTEVGKMTPKNYNYLENIILLAKEKQIPLLFVVAPYMEITVDEKKIYNEVKVLADKYGIQFVDFNEFYEQIGLNPATDFAESSHLNYYGSEKYSAYLGAYISENYTISDRRNNEKYVSWQANSQFYRSHAANVDIKKTVELKELLEKIFENKDRYTICVTLDGVYEDECQNITSLLERYGMDTVQYGTWVFKEGELVYTLPKCITEDTFYYNDLGRQSLTIITQMRRNEAQQETYPFKNINLEGIGCNAVTDGVNILVYDDVLQETVVITGANALDEYHLVTY